MQPFFWQIIWWIEGKIDYLYPLMRIPQIAISKVFSQFQGKIVLAALVLSQFSCQKKWKETTGFNLSYKYDNAASTLPGLSIISVTMNLNQFTFSGSRKEGGNVSFQNNMGTTTLNISQGGSGNISYQLPQGDYTQMTIALNYSRPDTSPVILINAVYHDTLSHTALPIIVQIASSLYTSSVVKNSSGGQEIVVTTGNSLNAKVNINPSFWMSSIDSKLLHIAVCDTMDGQLVMNINKYKNAEIYRFIVNNITPPPIITIQ